MMPEPFALPRIRAISYYENVGSARSYVLAAGGHTAGGDSAGGDAAKNATAKDATARHAAGVAG